MIRREFLKGALAAGACQSLPLLTPSATDWTPSAAGAETSPERWSHAEPANQPIGTAHGIFPGRVVWVHDAGVTSWDGDTETGGWYEDRFVDAQRAEAMLRKTLHLVSGAKTDAEAWKNLFRYNNRQRGRGDVGYQPGEKVAVKLNMNCCQRRVTYTQGFYNTPQLTLALFRQLVHEAGIREADLVVVDASRFIPDSIFDRCHAEFPAIRFEDRDGDEGRFRTLPDMSKTIAFADPDAPALDKTYLPQCLTGATYQINAAVFKGHSLAGVTLCAKNHYGSVFRTDAGPKDPHRGWNPSHLHGSITTPRRPLGTYNAIVDLMGHPDLGGKTILYLLDALYAAPHQSKLPEKWELAPFGGHWTDSVFASQDPVAIESIGVDFFAAEAASRHMVGAVDNYLHEAALAHDPPSGVRYAPGGDGKRLSSLGVHEHWNNPERKQYTRDLGTGEGIELLRG
ncbi:MAG: DUF362 domain-containing protein [Thermoguttaceae bacterium]|jgi:hypothetical protein|nr:DUF362 domain-containing protein [Thermoguttaceae bacterium]